MAIIGYGPDGRPINDSDIQGFDASGRPVQRGVDSATAFARGASDGLTFSWGDEAAGGIAGVVGAMRRGEWNPLTGVMPSLQSGNFRRDYDRQVAQSRANLEQAREEQPLAAGAGQVTGAIASSFLPGGAVGRVTRGAPLLGRMGMAYGSGAAAGAISGAGAGNTDEERLQGLMQGGFWGGLLGAGAHGVLGEALPSLWRAGRRVAGLPAEATRMGVAERARDDLMHVARQNERLGVRDFNDLGQVIDQAAQRDPTLTVAEALGRSAINRVVKYSRLPGRTAERAERTLERNADTFDELTNRLDQGLTPRADDGAPLTMRDASGELDASFARVSTEGYQQALANRLTTEQANAMQALLRRHPEFYQRAINEAQMIARGEGIQGFQGITDPRLFHYLKVGASDVLRTMRREGLGATRARQYTQSIRALTDELDKVPGYRDARQQWGSLSEAREALDAGFSFDRMRPDDMRALVERLTPFQRRYLQAGVSERIRDVLARRDNDGLINIARDLTNRRRGELLRAAFGDKRAPIDDFLEYARLRRQMHNDARRMASSQESPTGIVTGEGLADAVPVGAISLRAVAARTALDNTIGRLGERQRDIMGRVLLTPVGEFKRAQGGLLSRANREAQRRAARTRLNRTRAALYTGLGSAGVYEPGQDQ